MIRDSNEKNAKYRVGYLFLILSKRMKSFARTDGRIFLYKNLLSKNPFVKLFIKINQWY